MSTGTYAPDPDLHVVDANGLPVSGGLVWTYVAGTLTPIATYTDVALTVPNSNPIVAGSDGRFVAFLSPGSAYKFVYETAPTPPATHGAVLATRDNLTAIPIASPSTDVPGTAGQLLTQGQCVYLSTGAGGKTAGQWFLASAAQLYSSLYCPTIGFVVNTALAGTQVLVRLSGQIAIPGLTLSPGGGYYVSATPGAITSTMPSPYPRVVGQALDVATLSVGSQQPAPNNGLWIDVPFNAANYTADTGTVGSINQLAYGYTLLGLTAFVNLYVILTPSAATVSIYVALPTGVTPVRATAGPFYTNAGTGLTGLVTTSSGVPSLRCFRDAVGTNWVAGAPVYLALVLPVSI